MEDTKCSICSSNYSKKKKCRSCRKKMRKYKQDINNPLIKCCICMKEINMSKVNKIISKSQCNGGIFANVCKMFLQAKSCFPPPAAPILIKMLAKPQCN